ncbi:histone chaperone ASF1-like [Oscarella lobularis]|uniref:histone chaperone ASF1-like n=1 Tax=Oscarella lobularis TaxID=121494 RepID=UPI003313A771
MAKVQISSVTVLDNPSLFFTPFQFEIVFECIENLIKDLEFKIIYVGSASSKTHDQTLDSILVGPIPAGRHVFVFEAPPPKPDLIPFQDAVGVTVVLLTASYLNQEFTRVGYYVNNEYSDPEMKENPPTKVEFDKLQRNILATNPRITRFKIDWEGTEQEAKEQEQEQEEEQEEEEEERANEEEREEEKEDQETPIHVTLNEDK